MNEGENESSSLYYQITFLNPERTKTYNINFRRIYGSVSKSDYIDASIDSVCETMNITENDITVNREHIVNGSNGFSIEYITGGLHYYQYCIIKNNYEYAFTYGALEDYFDKTEADEALNTFVVE